MQNRTLTENWQYLAMWLALTVTALACRPLIPIDETRYLSVAWEMWQNHSFLVPYSNGVPYSHKPPLLFWIFQASWWLFGVGEWPVRMVAPIFGLAAVFLTKKLAILLWPERENISRSAPFILMGTGVWAVYSTLTLFDTLISCCSLIALTMIFLADRRPHLGLWFGFSLALGAGILAKGPVILVYVLPAVILAPWWSTASGRSWPKWYGCALLSLAGTAGLALCWAVPAAIAGGSDYAHSIFFSQTAGRIVQAFAHRRPFYWYLMLLPLLTFPWFFWRPVWRGWWRTKLDPSSRFCLSALAPAFFVLSLISGKQIHYILPLLPLTALLIARGTFEVPSTWEDRLKLALPYLLLSLGFWIGLQLPRKGGDAAMLHDLPRWIAALPLACSLPLLARKSISRAGTKQLITVSLLLLVVSLHLSLAQPLRSIFDVSSIACRLQAADLENKEIAVLPAELADQFHFAGRLAHPLYSETNWDRLAEWAIKNPDHYCLIFTRSKSYALLTGDGIAQHYKDGWLIFRQANNLLSAYQAWAPVQ